jgi:WD40 repeat protein
MMERKWPVVCVPLLSVCLLHNAPSAAEESTGLPVEEIERTEAVDFQSEILPVLQKNCLACHNRSEAESDVVLESPETMRSTESGTELLVTGAAHESQLFQVAAHLAEPIMPPDDNDVGAANLTPRELGLLKLWIEQGAAEVGESASTEIMWRPLAARVQPIYALSVAPLGVHLAAGRGQVVQVYHVETNKLVASLSDRGLRDRLPGLSEDARPPSHLDLVQALAFSPDGRRLASGGYQVVKLWQRPRPAPLKNMERINEPTGALAASGDRLAVAQASGEILVFDTRNGQRDRAWQGHEGTVTGLSFSPDGSRLASVGADKVCRIWGVDEETPQVTLAAPTVLTRVVWDGQGTHVAAAGEDQVIRCWEVSDKAPDKASSDTTDELTSRELKGHTARITALAALTAEPPRIVSASADGTVRIWEPDSGKQVARLNHGGPVTAMAAGDGRIISVGDNKLVRFWEAGNGEQIAERRGNEDLRHQAARARWNNAVAKRLVEAAERDLQSANVQVMSDEEELKKAEEEFAKAEEVLKKKNEAASGEKPADNAEAERTAAQRAVEASRDRVARRKAALQSAKDAVAAAQQAVEDAKRKADETQRQVAEREQQVAQSERPFVAVAWIDEDQTFAAADNDGRIHLFHAGGGQPIDVSQQQPTAPLALVSLGGSQLAALREDGQLTRWNVSQDWTLERAIGTGSDGPVPADRVTALDFSPDGKLLATGGGEPSRLGEVMLWDAESGRHVRTVDDAHSDTVLSLAFSPDGRYLASASADRTMKVFTIPDGQFVRAMEGHTHHVLGVAWRADGRMLVTGGADNVAKVWEFPSGTQKKTIEGFGKQVTSVQYLGLADNFIVTTAKGAVTTKTSTGGGGPTYGGSSGFVYCGETSAEGKVVAAGGEQGIVWVWAEGGKAMATLEPP